LKLFKGAFQRVEQIKKSLTYLHGLLGNAARKNVEQMALGQKEKVRTGLSLKKMSKSKIGQVHWRDDSSPHNPGSHR